MSTIKVYPQNITDEPIEINAPEGEAFYWARQVRKYAGAGMIQFTAEVPCVAFLGFVALPDELAALAKQRKVTA